MSDQQKILTDHQADKLAHIIDEEILSMVGTRKKSMTFVFDDENCSTVTNCADNEMYLRFCIITMNNIYRDLYGKRQDQ